MVLALFFWTEACGKSELSATMCSKITGCYFYTNLLVIIFFYSKFLILDFFSVSYP